MKLRNDLENSFTDKLLRWMSGDLQPADVHEPKKYPVYEEEAEEENEFIKDVIAGAEEAQHEEYQQWKDKKDVKRVNRIYTILSVLVCVGIIGVLLYTVAFLPTFGDKTNPDNNEVSKRYIENGLEETGAVNIVAGMILDYRAFDTYGESNVLFIACCCVLILLRNDDKKNNVIKDEQDAAFEYNPILGCVTKVAFPIILMFGICIILNGHLSPGGGFSGGAIIGAGLILYANAFGFEKLEKFFTYKTFKGVVFVALLFYGLAKSYSFFTGANHLENIIPKGTPGAILSSGLILPLNICVGIVVACTMYGFYSLFKRGGISDD
jgi:multicomponent Na+:H+ antiporter subunit B